jgi:hypothetical protein
LTTSSASLLLENSHESVYRFQLGDILLRNRFVMTPMTRSRAHNDVATEQTALYYPARICWPDCFRIYQAAISDCRSCPLKKRCTKAERRYLMRHAHEAGFERNERMERMERRMKAHPEVMVNRRASLRQPETMDFSVTAGSCCASCRALVQ